MKTNEKRLKYLELSDDEVDMMLLQRLREIKELLKEIKELFETVQVE